MRPVVVEAVGEGVDVLLQLVDAVREIEAGIDLVAPFRSPGGQIVIASLRSR